jgi:hypothetical protein
MFIAWAVAVSSSEAIDQVAATKNGTFIGIDVDVVFFDEKIPTGGFIAVPVAITNRMSTPDLQFIEAGPIKDCRSGRDCKLHPYYAREKLNGDYEMGVEDTIFLGSGLNYGYKVDWIATNQYKPFFCSAACTQIAGTIDMERDFFPQVFTAVESSGTPVPRWLNPVALSQAKARTDATWSSWCFTDTNNTIPDGQVVPKPCINSGWFIRSGFRVYLPSALANYIH